MTSVVSADIAAMKADLTPFGIKANLAHAEILANGYRETLSPDSWAVSEAAVFLDYALGAFPLTHYFLDEGVFDFCRSSARKLTSDFCAEFAPVQGPLKSPRTKRNLFPSLSLKEDGCRYADPSKHPEVFVVHFPREEQEKSLVFCTYFCFIRDEGHKVEKDVCFLAATDGYMSFICNKNADECGQIHPDSSAAEHFLFGFSLYLQAFPELVSDQQVGGIKKFKRIGGKHVSVSKNATVTEDVQNSKSPHWRRGHFRLLSADRYKENKGNVIFVKGTFVKGRALQVENVERVMSHA